MRVLGSDRRPTAASPDGSTPIVDLALCVFSSADGRHGIGAALTPDVLHLAPLLGDDLYARGSLNAFLAEGASVWRATLQFLQDLAQDPAARSRLSSHLIPMSQVTLHLPVEIGDYVDFYASRRHAENLGRILRPGTEPLNPNWRHLPVGYHGQAGTVVVSGTPIRRPRGLVNTDGSAPEFSPSRRLDIEAEVGFVIGTGSALGDSIPTTEFAEHVFGVVVVNDWSARDIQAFEAAPLGPFLGKSFATSISPWVVPLDVLEAARVRPPPQDPPPAPYLREVDPWGLDLTLSIVLNGTPISAPRFAQMYWSPAQQLAHLSVNGASTRAGDLFASGTVSSESPDEFGSLIELTWNGERPIELADGSSRTFLEDGDTVTIAATAPGGTGGSIALGTVEGSILPARQIEPS